MFKKIKKSWNNFLERLAKENEEQFQGKRPDCCGLNKPQPKQGGKK